MENGLRSRTDHFDPQIVLTALAMTQVKSLGIPAADVYGAVQQWLRGRQTLERNKLLSEYRVIRSNGLEIRIRRQRKRGNVLMQVRAGEKTVYRRRGFGPPVWLVIDVRLAMQTPHLSSASDKNRPHGDEILDSLIPPDPDRPMHRPIRASVYLADASEEQQTRVENALSQLLSELGFEKSEPVK